MDTDEQCSPEMKVRKIFPKLPKKKEKRKICLIVRNALQAQILYLKGEELERKNRYYDAIVYYRKALRLVPDIEMRMYRGNNRLKDNNSEDNKGRGKSPSTLKDRDSM